MKLLRSYNNDMKNTNLIHLLDYITIIASMLGLTISVEDVSSWLGLACTIICLVSGLVTLVLRVIALFKKYTSEDSKGGKELTDDELKDIANVITDGVKDVTNKAKEVKKDGNTEQDSK